MRRRRWSPDGKRLLYAEIVRIDAITGTQTPMTKPFIGKHKEPQDMIWHAMNHLMVWTPLTISVATVLVLLWSVLS